MKLDRFQWHNWITSLAVLAAIILFLGGCVLINHPPVITSLKAEREVVPTLGNCQIECTASDEDGTELNYEWSASDGNIDGNGPIVTWTAPKSVGNYTITVKVSDDSGGQDTGRVTLTVQPNHPPTVENLVVIPKEPKYLKEYSEGYKVFRGKSYEIECVASDLDGDKLRYKWLANGGKTDGGTISGKGSAVTWTAPLQRGEVTVTVTVSDSSRGIATESIVFRVETCACVFR